MQCGFEDATGQALALVLMKHAGQEDQFGMCSRELWQDKADAGTILGKLLPERAKIIDFVPIETLEIQNQAASGRAMES